MTNPTVEINGTHYPVTELDDLTNSEIAAVERISGQSIAGLGDLQTPRGALFSTFALMVMRRVNPQTTAQEAGNIPWKTTKRLIGLGADDDAAEVEGDDPKANTSESEPETLPLS